MTLYSYPRVTSYRFDKEASLISKALGWIKLGQAVKITLMHRGLVGSGQVRRLVGRIV